MSCIDGYITSEEAIHDVFLLKITLEAACLLLYKLFHYTTTINDQKIGKQQIAYNI